MTVTELVQKLLTKSYDYEVLLECCSGSAHKATDIYVDDKNKSVYIEIRQGEYNETFHYTTRI